MNFLEESLAEFEKKLTSLASKADDYQVFKEKFVESSFAMSYITTRLYRGTEINKEAERRWKKKQLYQPSFHHLNFTLRCQENCPLEYGQAKTCKTSYDKTSLYIHFIVPQISPDMTILKAEPFTMMHQEDGQTFKIKYTGKNFNIHIVTILKLKYLKALN